jgi:hypothetical protein
MGWEQQEDRWANENQFRASSFAFRQSGIANATSLFATKTGVSPRNHGAHE